MRFGGMYFAGCSTAHSNRATTDGPVLLRRFLVLYGPMLVFVLSPLHPSGYAFLEVVFACHWKPKPCVDVVMLEGNSLIFGGQNFAGDAGHI